MTIDGWIALISPVVAIFIAMFGFRRSRRADQLAAFFQLQDRYLAPEVRTGRRLIYERVRSCPASDIADLPDDVRAAVGYTLAVMNSVAIACEAKYVDRTFVLESMGNSYAGAIAAAKPYIDHVERTRGHRPYQYAERLAAAIGVAASSSLSTEPGEPNRAISS